MSSVIRNSQLWFPNRFHTNRRLEILDLASRGLVLFADLHPCFRICKMLVFTYAKYWFSHDPAHMTESEGLKNMSGI